MEREFWQLNVLSQFNLEFRYAKDSYNSVVVNAVSRITIKSVQLSPGIDYVTLAQQDDSHRLHELSPSCDAIHIVTTDKLAGEFEPKHPV